MYLYSRYIGRIELGDNQYRSSVTNVLNIRYFTGFNIIGHKNSIHLKINLKENNKIIYECAFNFLNLDFKTLDIPAFLSKEIDDIIRKKTTIYKLIKKNTKLERIT